MQYTELHLHTHYSLMDGLNTPEEYMSRAAELGMTHLAVTDHGNLSAHREFQRAAKEHGITPILGMEAYISPTDRFDNRPVKKRDDNTQLFHHVGLLAINENGLRNLNKLSELAWTEGYYHKPRIDFDLLEEYSDDIIVLSGCLNGLIAKAIANNLPQQANQWAAEFKRVFGERFFIEIQRHNPREINEGLLNIAKKFQIKHVVTSDCHHAHKEDIWREDAMLILSTSPKPDYSADFQESRKMEMMDRLNYLYPDRQMTFQEFELYLHSAEDHMNGQWPADDTWDMKIVEEGIANTMVVAGMIEEYPYHESLDLLPYSGENADAELREKTIQGLRRRIPGSGEREIYRVTEELHIIQNKNFSPYILLQADAIEWAKSQGIRVGPGRGSVCGSLVCYALGITNVNPLEHNLLFSRFISEFRDDFPDIDTDFEDRRRNEVKEYMRRKYGNVASIATFNKFQGKNSVRDAARVFMIPLGEVNKALKGADYPANAPFFDLWLMTPNGAEFNAKYPEAVDLAKFLQGRIRSQGMHAGGLVVSNRPIAEIAPMQSQKDPADPDGGRIPLVALDMKEVAKIGLIKLDYLGLKALSVIGDTLYLVKERWNIDIDLENLPPDDPKVYEVLSEGYTKGIFQAEAFTYSNLLVRMGGVTNFAELAASNALVRPGAMDSSAGAAFIKRKNGEEHITYHHELMKPFTEETYGTIIYQEQVMQTMTQLAGMSEGLANEVRSIIGKKRDVSEFEQYKAEFIEGASKNVPKDIAEMLWHDFEAHANYSFNKSHAVAYSMLSYWTAWLKIYHPMEYMVSMLKNEKNKDTRLEYLVDAKRMGLRVKLPHVNLSGKDFEIQGGLDPYIRFGLNSIKYISDKVATNLMAHRPYENYAHLSEVVMTKGSGLSTRTLHALNAIGGATFEDHPLTGDERHNYYEFLSIPAFDMQELPPKVRAQFVALDDYDPDAAFVCSGMVRAIKRGDGWARIELVDETGSAGIFTNPNTPIETGKVYVLLVSQNRVARFIAQEDLMNKDKFYDDDFREFLFNEKYDDVPDGMYKVVAWQSRTTKANKKMGHVVLADANKNLTGAMVFPGNYAMGLGRMPVEAVVDVQLAKTKDGALFVGNVL